MQSFLYGESPVFYCSYELFNEVIVLLELLIGLVGQIGHDYGNITIRLLHGVVDIAYKLVHVQSLILPVLHQWQVDFLDDVGEVV